jgi:hypothetical protein
MCLLFDVLVKDDNYLYYIITAMLESKLLETRPPWKIKFYSRSLVEIKLI